MTGSSDNEELALFNELVSKWFEAGGFDACDSEEQKRRSRVITSIRRKLQGSLRGRTTEDVVPTFYDASTIGTATIS